MQICAPLSSLFKAKKEYSIVSETQPHSDVIKAWKRSFIRPSWQTGVKETNKKNLQEPYTSEMLNEELVGNFVFWARHQPVCVIGSWELAVNS